MPGGRGRGLAIADTVPWGKNTPGIQQNSRKISYFFVDFFEKVFIIPYCMDTMNDCMIPKFGDLAELAGSKIVVGVKQLRKAVNAGRATAVWLAENADPAMTLPLEELCKANGIPCTWVCSMQSLGSACGIDVGAAAAAAVD